MYKYLIFDLDDTLTNDYENCIYAFKAAIALVGEEYTLENFLRFREIDKFTWNERAAGRFITPYEDDKVKMTEWIRASRFMTYFGENTYSYEKFVEISNCYMNGMKEHVVARDGAKEIIEYLHSNGYKIIIATNGPIIPLETKINKLEIDQFVDVIFSAEEVGYMKPKKQYYEGLFNKVHIENKEEILFIGDDLEKDIKGGIENGLDTCWVNYNDKITSEIIPKYEIISLNELKNIL